MEWMVWVGIHAMARSEKHQMHVYNDVLYVNVQR